MPRKRTTGTAPQLSTEHKIRELLRTMTLEEKAAQLGCVLGDWLLDNGELSTDKLRQYLRHGIGEVGLGELRLLPLERQVELINQMQEYALSETRLGIPILFHWECLHGFMAHGAASFPQAIALASTWEPAIVERVAAAAGREAASRGVLHALSPTINLARDPRCGRTEETYGEDPYLSSRMAAAFVRGIQSEGVAATAKHFVANFEGPGGRDSFPVYPSERELREVYFVPFIAAIRDAGAQAVMAAYGTLDGTPCTCHPWLLRDILRREWGFEGVVVSDYWSAPHIHELHHAAETPAEAACRALAAGLDLELPVTRIYAELPKLVRSGRVPLRLLDESVARVLRFKYRQGAFAKPFADAAAARALMDAPEHRALALEAARKCLVLLKNRANLLPLDARRVRRLAVIGPNAEEMRLGGYSAPGVRAVSPLEGIRARAQRAGVEVVYRRGCGVVDQDTSGIAAAVEAARTCDAAVLVMGNNASHLGGDGITEGEQRDRCDLRLPGVQEQLIRAVAQTGTPVAVVLVNGSAVLMLDWINQVHAVLEAWYCGEEGGTAIAEALFGDINPGGKLPLTFPKVMGVLPWYYNHAQTGRRNDYVDLFGPPKDGFQREPFGPYPPEEEKTHSGRQELFPFGWGLSYTTFEYSNLRIAPHRIPPDGTVTVSVEVANTGARAGDEVVQLYLRDDFSTFARPVMELKGFRRITLQPGERQTVSFTLGPAELAGLDARFKPVVEPGRFLVMVGSSSAQGLTGEFHVVAPRQKTAPPAARSRGARAQRRRTR